jgi:hypothetical protein
MVFDSKMKEAFSKVIHSYYLPKLKNINVIATLVITLCRRWQHQFNTFNSFFFVGEGWFATMWIPMTSTLSQNATSFWWHNQVYDPFVADLIHALSCVLHRLLVSSKSYPICIYVNNSSKVVPILSWFFIFTFKILLASFLLVGNDETLWSSLGRNWLSNHFSFENFEFCGIQIH